LYENFKYMKTRKNETNSKIIKEEMKECTFKPKITNYKSKKEEESKDSSRVDGLFTTARSKQEKFEQLKEEIERQREEKEMSECSF